MNIRDEIVQKRREDIARLGHTHGHPVPETRAVPLNTFSTQPLLICEFKRRSPSKGALNETMDPVEQAGIYKSQGARSLSVLTEEHYFGGSLGHLMAIKEAHPDLAVLRKDFLIDRDDVLVSFQAGADAILLIAAMLPGPLLHELHDLATALGMETLVELHGPQDVEKVRDLAPPLVGINCRNLEDFSLDLLGPLALKHHINWPCTLIFESGIFGPLGARFAVNGGFHGLLVGEAVVKNPHLIPGIKKELPDHTPMVVPGKASGGFWEQLTTLRSQRALTQPKRPLVKICGITTLEDAELVVSHGADILGFVFAESPRRATRDVVTRIANHGGIGHVLRVAVVTGRKAKGDFSLDQELVSLVKEGYIHAIQLSGDEEYDDPLNLSIPWYKAVRPQSPLDLQVLGSWQCPRVLIDAAATGTYGGSGHRVHEDVLGSVKGPLWLAGGLNDTNVATIVQTWKPELIDVASGLEASPGHKDPQKVVQFFKELQK